MRCEISGSSRRDRQFFGMTSTFHNPSTYRVCRARHGRRVVEYWKLRKTEKGGEVWLFVWRMSGRVLGDGGQRNGRKLVNWARPASVGMGVGIGSVVEFTCERRTDALRRGAPYHPQATGDKARRFRPTHPSSKPACPDVDLPVSGLSSRRACCCPSSQPCCPAARAANPRPSAARKQEA